jgi:tRNA(Ile)-lysidine synthase
LKVFQLSVKYNTGASPEAAAREARYQLVAELLGEGDIYLTAHHADDQAETMFLNLMRGSGSQGLAGIPAIRNFAQGWLARPLLNVRRKALEDYLNAEQVGWVTDTSNQDQSLDRNYLRSAIFPQLDQRWPGLVKRLNQTSRNLQDQNAAIRMLLAQAPRYLSSDGVTLPLTEFNKAAPVLQAEIIRNWARERSASPPPRARLHEFLLQLQSLRADSQAELKWGRWLIKRQAKQLWMHEMPLPASCPACEWKAGSELVLGRMLGKLLFRGATSVAFHHLRVSCRAMVSKDSNISRSDKNIIKENMRILNIPVWLRETIPLLIQDNELCAIGDWWFSRGFRQQLRTAEYTYIWQPEDLLLLRVQSFCHNCSVDPEAPLV